MLDDFKAWIDDNSTAAFIIGLIIFGLVCFIWVRSSGGIDTQPRYKMTFNGSNCTNIIGIYDQSGDIVCSFGTDLWFSCTEKIRQQNGKYRPIMGC